jgi:hypothetical protein
MKKELRIMINKKEEPGVPHRDFLLELSKMF